MKKRRSSNPNQEATLNPSFLPSGEPVPSAQLFDLVRKLQEGDNRVLLSFSGKDSLAAWLYLRENGFEVIPYWCYMVPNLSYDDEMLAYYQEFFGTKIYRLLHPAAYALLYGLSWQPPDTARTILNMGLHKIDFNDLETLLVSTLGLHPDTFRAVGIRAADNMMRHRLVRQMGPLGFKKRRYWWTVWDFKLQDVIAIIHRYGVKLSRAYQILGATGDVLDYPVLKIIKRELPADHAKIVAMYPLIEAEIFRYECVK